MYPTVKKRIFHDDYRSAEQRIPLNQAALSVIRQYPVFGVGLNNGGKIFKQYDATGKSRIWKHSGHVVHNLFLAVCMDVGVVGLVAFLGIFIVSFRAAYKTLQRVSRWYRGVLIGISAGIIAHLVHGLFDPGFLTAMNISTLVFTLLGVIGAVSVMHRSGNDAPHRAPQQR
jgi:O-antigen ligase